MDSSITISRTQQATSDDVMRIQIVRPGQLVAVTLSLEAFARALTSENNVPCEVIRNAGR